MTELGNGKYRSLPHTGEFAPYGPSQKIGIVFVSGKGTESDSGVDKTREKQLMEDAITNHPKLPYGNYEPESGMEQDNLGVRDVTRERNAFWTDDTTDNDGSTTSQPGAGKREEPVSDAKPQI